jgi:hypothetical protein
MEVEPSSKKKRIIPNGNATTKVEPFQSKACKR